MIEVVHDLVEALWNLVIPVEVTASKLGILLAEEQGLRRLEWRLVVQALWVGISLQRDQEDHQTQAVSSPQCHSSHCTGENCKQRCLVLSLRNTNGVVEFLRQLVVAGGLSPANTCKCTHKHTHVALGQRSGRNTATQGPLIQQPCHTHIHISTNTHFSIPSLFPPCLLLCLSLFSLAFSHSSADAFLLLAAGLHHTLAASLPRMNPCLFLLLSHTEHASPFISPTFVCVNPVHVNLRLVVRIFSTSYVTFCVKRHFLYDATSLCVRVFIPRCLLGHVWGDSGLLSTDFMALFPNTSELFHCLIWFCILTETGFRWPSDLFGTAYL